MSVPLPVLRRAAPIALALLGGCSLPSSLTTPLMSRESRAAQADATIRRAIDAFKEGRTATAHGLLDQAVSEKGGDSQARAEVGAALIGAGRSEAALRLLQPLLSDRTNRSPMAWEVLALAARKQYDHPTETKAHEQAEAAAEALRKRFGARPKDAAGSEALFDLFLDLGAYERLRGSSRGQEAIAAYREAAAVIRFSPLGLTRLGRALADYGVTEKEKDEAVQRSLEAIQYSHEGKRPAASEIEMYDAYGWALCQRRTKTDDLAQARRVLTEAVEAAPGAADIHYHLAQTFFRDGLAGRAALEVRRALLLQPDFPEAEALRRQLEHLVPGASPAPSPAPSPTPSPAAPAANVPG